MAKTASTIIDPLDPTGEHIVGYAPITGGGQKTIYDWDLAAGQNAQGQTDADVYTNWLNSGLMSPAMSAPKYTGALKLGNSTITNPEAYGMENEARSQWGKDYIEWLNLTGGENRIATQEQLENPTLAEDIPTVTNAKFNSMESLLDSVSNAGWVIISTGEKEQLTAVDVKNGDPGVRATDVVVAKYDPTTGNYSNQTTFRVVDYGDYFYTTRAMDAAGGKGLTTTNSMSALGELTGVPGMALGTRSIPSSNASTITAAIPEIPSLTLSEYRALDTDQRAKVKQAVEANKQDWNEWLSGLKNPAPAVISYTELRTMNATDKAALRQQVEDAGLLWSDYIDQIYSPWSTSFSSPSRVTYATYRG
jgi:hypothetical protein